MNSDQEPINFTTERMLAMYSAGVHVADIADDFETSHNAVYACMKEHPEEYAAAKLELLKFRNAKHRRVSALATDLQMDYLVDLASKPIRDLTAKEMTAIQKIGEKADRQADLNEGKATEITETKGTTMEIIFPTKEDGFNPENL